MLFRSKSNTAKASVSCSCKDNSFSETLAAYCSTTPVSYTHLDVYKRQAQAFVNSDTTGTMTYTLLEQPTFTYRMVISSTKNHALAGILTKAMYAMPQYLVEDLAAQYTTYKATELTVVDWIRLHPVVTVLVLLIFGWLLTTMAAVSYTHLFLDVCQLYDTMWEWMDGTGAIMFLSCEAPKDV